MVNADHQPTQNQFGIVMDSEQSLDGYSISA